ncbi:nuclear factor, interleukin 3 regulated, member 3 [Paramisgurnus dabryanus]|uniref:nuclear factor, interleukin 3 regulated, member 3 n=1 Tax=Paramisgurnus dabryanus TaxID=90735 RepID=UPI003CCF727D
MCTKRTQLGQSGRCDTGFNNRLYKTQHALFLSISKVSQKKDPFKTCDSNTLRRKCEFIPTEKKDESYWDKRKKKNEPARCLRKKRRFDAMVAENKVLALLEDNARLKAKLLVHKFRFGLIEDSTYSQAPVCCFGTHKQAYVTARHNYYGVQRMPDRPNMSEDSRFFISEASSFGSPVFSDDALGEQRDDLGCEFNTYILAANRKSLDKEKFISRCRENMKGLPHKLCFKTSGGFEGVDTEVLVLVELKNVMDRRSVETTGRHCAIN